MRAVRLYEDGLRLDEIPRPEPADGEVLVRVHAAAITRDELTWPTDRLPRSRRTNCQAWLRRPARR